jgi:hypothetical protein
MDGVGVILFVIVGLAVLYAANLVIAWSIKSGIPGILRDQEIRIVQRWVNVIVIAFLASFTVFEITQNGVVSGLALFLIFIQGYIPEKKKRS